MFFLLSFSSASILITLYFFTPLTGFVAVFLAVFPLFFMEGALVYPRYYLPCSLIAEMGFLISYIFSYFFGIFFFLLLSVCVVLSPIMYIYFPFRDGSYLSR